MSRILSKGCEVEVELVAGRRLAVMATSAYLSPGPPPLSDTQEEGGVMNLVNPAVTSQSYSVPREQVVRISSTFSTWQILLLANCRLL